MSVTVMLKATLKDGQENRLKELMSKFLVQTRTYDGFKDITIYKEDNSSNIVFYSIWDKKEDFQNYLNFRVQSGDMGVLAQVFEGEPQISFYNDLKL